MTDLDENTVVPYLRERGLVESDADPQVAPLGGGVSNVVLQVRTGENCLVVKRPLPNLDVAADWPADVDRVHNEADAARAYAELLGDTPGVRVPGILHEDEEAHVVAFECAPDSATMWKRNLLDGRVDGTVARRLGTVLGRVHDRAPAKEGLRAQFANDKPFEQLRLTPYHRTVAEKHPDVGERIQEEIGRIAGQSRTLVHGDYSPKNVLCIPDEPTLWILDFEVAHWGDPAFDAAFMLNHLFIKSVYNRGQQPEYLDAARGFWDAYRDETRTDERNVVTELAVLMLARVDGRSPVEYVTREATRETLRTISKRSLTEEYGTVEGFADLVTEVSGS